MFDSAQLDQRLLDCLEWLEQAGTVALDLPDAANDVTDVRTMLINTAHEKLNYLSLIIDADVSKLDHPMVSVKRWTDSQGNECLSITTVGDKLQAIEKLMKLAGGFYNDDRLVQPCY